MKHSIITYIVCASANINV